MREHNRVERRGARGDAGFAPFGGLCAKDHLVGGAEVRACFVPLPAHVVLEERARVGQKRLTPFGREHGGQDQLPKVRGSWQEFTVLPRADHSE